MSDRHSSPEVGGGRGASSSPAAKVFWFHVLPDGTEAGSIEEDVLIQKIKLGEISPDTKICLAGSEMWIRVQDWELAKRSAGQKPMSRVSPAEPETKPGGSSMLEHARSLVCQISGLEPLSDFRLSSLFSQAFNFRSREELDGHFNCGCKLTTPGIDEISSEWPQPRTFSQVLFLGLVVLLGFHFAFQTFQNAMMLPGLVIVGAFAVPVACVVFFFELNVLRNVSAYQVLRLILVGGVASLLISLMLYNVTHLTETFLGASAAGIVEETAKLLAAVLIVGNFSKYRWTLNGILFGAAVGAGFAGFETAGYIIQTDSAADFYWVLVERAVLSPFMHVTWTACVTGALWRVKGERPFAFGMLAERKFYRVFLFVMGLHMLWNTGLLWHVPNSAPAARGELFLWLIAFPGSWYLVLTLAQDGLRQIRAAQATGKPIGMPAGGDAGARADAGATNQKPSPLSPTPSSASSGSRQTASAARCASGGKPTPSSPPAFRQEPSPHEEAAAKFRFALLMTASIAVMIIALAVMAMSASRSRRVESDKGTTITIRGTGSEGQPNSSKAAEQLAWDRKREIKSAALSDLRNAGYTAGRTWAGTAARFGTIDLRRAPSNIELNYFAHACWVNDPNYGELSENLKQVRQTMRGQGETYFEPELEKFFTDGFMSGAAEALKPAIERFNRDRAPAF
ncbi:MAG TPA: PrsW family glutamic-type intramembrane protease [Verrucomicrobiae bacterium]|jgi:RsiW-degrading membrane proteinase PrsW (M82 family)